MMAGKQVYRLAGSTVWPGWTLVGVGWLLGCLSGMLLVIVFDQPAAGPAASNDRPAEELAAGEAPAAAPEPDPALEQHEANQRARMRKLYRDLVLVTWEGFPDAGPVSDDEAQEALERLLTERFGKDLKLSDWKCYGSSQWGPGNWGWRFYGFVVGGKKQFAGSFVAWIEYNPQLDYWSLPRLQVTNSSAADGLVIDGPLSPWMENFVAEQVRKAEAEDAAAR